MANTYTYEESIFFTVLIFILKMSLLKIFSNNNLKCVDLLALIFLNLLKTKKYGRFNNLKT